MNSISSFKRLSEPAWKSMTVKHKVRDNGLAKALSECAKQAVSEEYDGVLKSLVHVTDLAAKLRKEKEIALNRDLCAYLDEIAKEVGKARTAVAAEQKDADEAEAEEAESDAEAKLTQALRVQILAGLQKAKAVECSVLVCVATPVYAVMVAQSITAKHKALLTQVTGSTKFLALCGFSWDQERSSYNCIMDKRDAALKLKLEAAFKYYTATSVKVIIVERSEYEESETPETPEAPEPPETKEYKQKAYAPAKKSAKPSAGGDANEGETAEETSEPEEAGEEPLLTGVRPFDIGGSVGQGGKNAPDDVAQVQIALNRKGAKLEIDGKIGGQTIGAIKVFQKQIGIAYPDGLVEVGKKTATALASSGAGAGYAGGGNGGSGQYGGGGTGKYAGGGTGKYSGGGTGQYGGGGAGKYSGGGAGQYGGGGTGKYSGGGTGQYGGGGTGQYGGGTGQYGGGGTGQYGGGGTGEYGGSGVPRQFETGGNAGAVRGSGSSGETITGQAGFSQPEGTFEKVENAAGQAFEKQRSKVADTLEGLKNTLGLDPE